MKTLSEVEEKVEKKAAKKSGFDRVKNALGIFAVLAVAVIFIAPDRFWSSGVAPTAERKEAGDFTLEKIDGGIWNFAAERGRVVVVNYWATWCPPCRVEMPAIVRLADEYKSRCVSVVGVTMDENLSDVPPFVEKYQIKYPILLPGEDPGLSPEGMSLPTTLLYDKKGRLAKKYVGIVTESVLKTDIEKLLAEPST
jgi:thiol-disulfide isomerase/thioredoxin